MKRSAPLVLVSGGNRGIGFEACRALAGAGATVLLGARKAADGERAARELAKAGTVVALPLDVADPDGVAALKARVEKDFGALTRLSGEDSWRFTTRAWRIEKALSGGGPHMDVGIYVIQAACRAAMAQPVAITARELPKTRPELFNEVEEAIEWTMEFPGGVACRGSSSYSRNNNFFLAEGDKGWIRIEPAFGYGGLEVTTSRGPLSIPPVPQQSLQMDDFASCILTGRQTPVPGSMGRDHMAIIEAIYRSAADGGRRVLVQRA